MKKNITAMVSGLMIISVLATSGICSGQISAEIEKYFEKLPSGEPKNDGSLQTYRMTAIYLNRDLYGNFTRKTKVIGDYRRGHENGYVSWNNVYIANSDKLTGPFTEGNRQDYMENIKYIPTSGILDESTFKDFPSSPENVFARNLMWDMMAIENFAWAYSDSLQLNKKYVIRDIGGEFNMAEIGTYEHSDIQLCRTGISMINNKLCAVVEYRAIDNKIELSIGTMKTRGTEQYWGTTWISLETGQIEYAEMYSGTIQEIEISGLKDKFLVKTIRELWVERIN